MAYDAHPRVLMDDGTGAEPPNPPLGASSNPLSIVDGYQAPTSATWNSSTALNTALTQNTAGYDTAIVTIVTSGTITAGAVIFEAYDGANWVTIKSPRTDSYLTDTTYTLPSGGATHSWQVPVSGYPQMRVRLSTQITGAGQAAIEALVSSAPDVSLVTVGLDPNSTSPPVGSQSIATGQLSVGTSAALLVAARAGAVGTGRMAVVITNTGTATIYVGNSGVTTSTGLAIPAGQSIRLLTGAAIYAVSGTASQTASYLEEF